MTPPSTTPPTTPPTGRRRAGARPSSTGLRRALAAAAAVGLAAAAAVTAAAGREGGAPTPRLHAAPVARSMVLTPGATRLSPTKATGPAAGAPTAPKPTGNDPSPAPTDDAWPGPDNTGVPAGTHLTPSGTITITKDGTVVDGMDVTGMIMVRAKDVTIKDTRVRGCGPNGVIDTGFVGEGVGPVLIEDVEVDGLNSCDSRLIGSNNYTAVRVNAHGGRTGFGADHDVTIEDSWVHDLWYRAPAHQDAILSNGGRNYLFEHNNLECAGGGCAASIGMYGDFDVVSDVRIVDNLLNTTGSYCLYGGATAAKPFPNANNIQVSDNRFGRKFNRECGIYGPVSGFDPGSGNVWSDNVWADTGEPVDY